MPSVFTVWIPKSVQKDLLRIPAPWVERIQKSIDNLSSDPFMGEKMSGKLEDYRKIRVWPYRIIYRVEKSSKNIYISEVGHRGDMSYK